MPRQDQPSSVAVAAATWNIRIDAVTGEVVRALADRGIASIVLKGPALADWYPKNSGRTYVDGDLWVAPDDVEAAEQTLAQLGFAAGNDEHGLPSWWREHAISWKRQRDGGAIDLHRKLQGAGTTAADAWRLLWPESVSITVGGEAARRLSDVALALYVALHASYHVSGQLDGFSHIDAALESVPEETWRSAAALADRLDATESFAAGLRLRPTGRALAERLSLPPMRLVRTAIQLGPPTPVALGFDQLATAPWRRRPVIIARKVIPPPGFVRHWWPPAATSQGMLLVGYLYRPIWLLRRAPVGWRAWRAARRDVSGGRP